MRVTVPGAPPRTDVGFHVVAEENGDGHDTALKGAVTDGLKRALRSFGDRLGNGLYGEHPATGRPTPESAGFDADDSLARRLRSTILRLGMMQGFDEQQIRAAVKAKTKSDLDNVSASELIPLVEGATEKLQRSQQTEGQEAA